MSKALEDFENMTQQIFQVDSSFEMYADKVKQHLVEEGDLEKELGCTLVELLNGLKSKQAVLRYFGKYDAIHCHCKEGWYVNMIMYGWIPLKDFMKGLKENEQNN